MTAGWQTKLLSEVLKRTETVNPVQSPEVEFDYIDVSSVSNETFSIEATQRLKGKDAPSRARRLVRTGDVLFATIRPTLRRIAVVPKELDGQVCSTGYFVLRPCEDVDGRFLFYSLFTHQFSAAMEMLQKGASYPAVTDADIRSQPLSFPSLPEQRRIVAILDEAFDAIATAKTNTERNLHAVQDLSTAALNLAFPVGIGSVTLADLAVAITDGDHSPPPKAPTGIPFITISNVDKDARVIDFTDTYFVPRSYFDGLKANRRPQTGDVLYTVTGSFGIPVLIEDDREFCFQRHIGLIRPKPDTNSRWLSYALLSPGVFAQADARATGTAQRTVSLAVLRTLTVPRVSLEVQCLEVERLDAVFEQTARLRELSKVKLAALDELKKSLLHQAFTGKLTSKNTDKQLEAVA